MVPDNHNQRWQWQNSVTNYHWEQQIQTTYRNRHDKWIQRLLGIICNLMRGTMQRDLQRCNVWKGCNKMRYNLRVPKQILPFGQASSCHSYMLRAVDISSENPVKTWKITNLKISYFLKYMGEIQIFKQLLTCDVTYISPWQQFTLWRTVNASMGPSHNCKMGQLR